MLYNLGESNSIIGQYVAELRDTDIQTDRIRFRTNLERLGEIAAYEISKQLPYTRREVATPLGRASCWVLATQPVLATILRAGLPLHQGLLRYFDKADNAFIAAFRQHRSQLEFDINVGYSSYPTIRDRILIVSDPMLATGASMVLTLKELFKGGLPAAVHIVCAIACRPGIENVEKNLPEAKIWAAAVDAELDERSYIIPGLGDAGDLAFGEKLQR